MTGTSIKYKLTAWDTEELESRPLKNVTLSPVVIASTTWPPVTLVKSSLVRSVGTNWLWLVIADEGIVPFRTWYCRRAVSSPSFEVKDPNASLPTLAKASLEGARIVMFCALLRDWTSWARPGSARTPLRLVS